jgi:hypothetical protein
METTNPKICVICGLEIEPGLASNRNEAPSDAG